MTMFLLVSCVEDREESPDGQIADQTERAMLEANRQVGMPAIVNFQEKKIMKQIYELRDSENLIAHAYLVNEMNGEIGQYLGQCIGYGLPYSTQFSNPERAVDLEDEIGHNLIDSHSGVMPQPEPNGLFMPEGLSATWLLLIDPETGEPRPVYVEPAIIVSPFKLH